MEQRTEIRIGNGVDDMSALALGADKAAPPQTRQMRGYAALRRTSDVHQFGYGFRPIEKRRDDPEPGGVAQHPKEAGGCGRGILHCGGHVSIIYLENRIYSLFDRFLTSQAGTSAAHAVGPNGVGVHDLVAPSDTQQGLWCMIHPAHERRSVPVSSNLHAGGSNQIMEKDLAIG